MEGDVLNLILSVLGGVLGGSGLMGLYIHKQKRKVVFNETLFLEYKSVAQELANVLQDFLPLSLYPRYYTLKQCREVDEALSKFFFKHYLILPQRVLEELNCMHACLQNKKGSLYMVDNSQHTPILRLRNTDEEICALLDDVALVRREQRLSDIYRKYHKLPRYVYMKCQARHVITVLDREWELKNMSRWSEYRKKRTLKMLDEAHM